MPKKPLSERIIDADVMASRYLADFNELDDAGLGKTARAQALLDKVQFWKDRYNLLANQAERAAPKA